MRLDRPGHRDHPGAADGIGPLGLVRLAPFVAGDQQDHVRGRIDAELADHLRAFLARLAAGQAQFHQATRTEQAGRVEAGVELVPVEVAAIGIEHFAFVDAIGAGTCPHGIGRFKHAQRLGPRDQVDRCQRLAGRLAGELFGAKFHAGRPIRRRTGLSAPAERRRVPPASGSSKPGWPPAARPASPPAGYPAWPGHGRAPARRGPRCRCGA